MRQSYLILLFALLLSLGQLAYGAPDTRPTAADDPAYKPMPWHLVDVWWDLGAESPFESYSVDVTIDADVPADVSLYVAPLGIAHLNGTAFYGGLQTRSDGNTKADRKLRDLGPGLLMSMWGERGLDAIRPSDGGFLQSSGHEGDFVSVRRPYNWAKGTYTYRVVRMDRETVDGKPYTWVGAFVYSHAKDENVFVGALRFPGDGLKLARKTASFVEIYGRRRPVADIPKVTVTFANLRVNGEAVKGMGAKAVYPKGVPDYADAKAAEGGGGVVVKVGEAVEGRTKREAVLIGK